MEEQIWLFSANIRGLISHSNATLPKQQRLGHHEQCEQILRLEKFDEQTRNEENLHMSSQRVWLRGFFAAFSKIAA
jgi:hypothetical protein